MSFLIVGLGNIGREYADTRHNIGFMVLDAFAKASDTSFTTLRYGSLAQVRLKGKQIILLKPSTYMNLSGKAVKYWLSEERIEVESMLVVVDDLALPFGAIRMRKQGSDGGHNGLLSIYQSLQTYEYNRLRIGIGNDFDKGQQVDFVLSPWEDEEQKELPFVLNRSIEAIRSFVCSGIDKAMNMFNIAVKKEASKEASSN